MYFQRRGQKLLVILGTIITMLFPTYSSEVASASVQSQKIPQEQTPSIPVSEEDTAISAGSAATNSSTLNSTKNAKGLTLSQLLHKYPETFKTSGPRNKVIALTFDDVPDPRFTPNC